MNKNLLLAFALTTSTMAFSQQSVQPQKRTLAPKNLNTLDLPKQYPTAFPKEEKSASSSATRVKIGSSYNIYTALVSNSTCLTYNSDLNTIMFTHRQNSDLDGGSGIIQTTFSRDGGATWADGDYLLHTSQAHAARYPSGVLYNPNGNTDPNEAYAATFGPLVTSAWAGNFFTSVKLDGSNLESNYWLNDEEGVETLSMARITAVATADGKIRVMGDTLDWNASGDGYNYHTAAMMTGTFNPANNNFDWARTYFSTDFMNEPTGNTVVAEWYNSFQAWSVDGTIGYVVLLGILEGATGNEKAFLPVVYKSTDSGASWDLMDTMDWTGLTAITDHLVASPSLSSPKPYFTSGQGFDLTVDANGELHIACEVASAWSSHDDSLTYTATTPALYFYDVHTDGAGWDAFLIDSIMTGTYSNDEQINFDARLQISRSADANKIFYAWLATDPELSDVNEAPDVWARGYDVETGLATASTNFTAGTDYDGSNFFLYLSDMSITSGSSYTLPLTVSIPTGAGLDPLEHFYYSDITFDNSDFTMVPNNVTEQMNNAFGQITMYPNPAINVVNLDLSQLTAQNVTIEVHNMLGQNIFSANASNANKFQLDVSGFSAGIYIVEVSANGYKSTAKLRVK